MMRLAASRVWHGVAVVAGILTVMVVPLVATPYENLQLSLVIVFAVAILGLDLLTGHAGLVSLGQSAFFGLGAYVTAAMTAAGWPVPMALALACMLSAGAGLLVALPAMRLGSHALAMVTLALPVLAVPLAKRLVGITGGSTGLSASPLQAPDWTGLQSDQWSFYCLAILGGLMVLLAGNLTRGQFGRALMLIRLNEIVAVSTGVPVYKYKVAAFVCASLFGGIAGFMYVCAIGFISPESMNLLISLNLLIALVLGGLRSRAGALIGGGIVVFLPELANRFGAAQSGVINLVTGAAVLLVIFVARGGIASLMGKAWRKMETLIT